MRRIVVAAVILAVVVTGAVVRYWLRDRVIAKAPMFRALGADGVDDFLTTSLDEKSISIAGGYKDQPVPFYVGAEPRPDMVTVERMLSPDRKRHTYSSRADEVTELVAKGWIHERSEGYIRTGPGRGSTEVFALFNPTEDRHFFTASRAELKERLATGKWQQQPSLGFAWREP